MKKIFLYLFLLFLTLSPQSLQAQGEQEKKKFPISFLSEFGVGVSRINYNRYVENKTHINIYYNIGFMYKVNQNWGLGMHGNLNLYAFSFDPTFAGVRLRFSRYFKNGHEWNISPGVRRNYHNISLNNYDIESTYSWNEDIGIMAKYEYANGANNVQSILSTGLFLKGKKASVSAIASLIGAVLVTANAISNSR